MKARTAQLRKMEFQPAAHARLAQTKGLLAFAKAIGRKDQALFCSLPPEERSRLLALPSDQLADEVARLHQVHGSKLELEGLNASPFYDVKEVAGG